VRSAADDLALAEAPPMDPWDRFGWVMGVVWLVFLGFPIAGALTSDRQLAWRVLAVALIALFAAAYVHGFVRLGRAAAWQDVLGWGWHYVLLLAALTGVVAALVGFEALGMLAFVVAMGMFVLALPVALTVFAAAVATTVVAVLLLGDPGAFGLVALVVLVGGLCAVVRVLDHLAVRHRALTEDLVVSAERERVARDVHDVLGHSLTVVSVKAELAERLVDTDPDRAKAEMSQIQELTRQSLSEIRSTVGGLRVARLTDQIGAASQALTDSGIRADFPDDPHVVDPRHRVVLAWALREAVTNVVRHSGARTCTVRLGADWLTVVDDGRGLPASNRRREGNGIRGLRERVRAAGGTVSVDQGSDGRGTEVRVRL
jgi:two-component system, NarL family, sensor histidine kinase DesK